MYDMGTSEAKSTWHGDNSGTTSAVSTKLSSIRDEIIELKKKIAFLFSQNKYSEAAPLQKQVSTLKKQESILKTKRRLMLVFKVRRWMVTAIPEIQESSLSWYLELDVDSMTLLKEKEEQEKRDIAEKERLAREAREAAKASAIAKRMRLQKIRRDKKERELRKKQLLDERRRKEDDVLRRLAKQKHKKEMQLARLRQRGEEKRRLAGFQAGNLFQALEMGWRNVSAPPKLRTAHGKPQQRVVVSNKLAHSNYFPSVNKQMGIKTPNNAPKLFTIRRGPATVSRSPRKKTDRRRPMKIASPVRRSLLGMRLESATTHHVLF